MNPRYAALNPRYAALLERADRSELTREEVDAVAEELRHPLPDSEPYYLLDILGTSQAAWHRDLVESFLEDNNDPWFARKALQVLCEDWRGRDRYVDQIGRFLAGVPWDEDDWVRLVAISEAGEYLRAGLNEGLLRELLRIFDDESQRGLLREAAYDALARAVGRRGAAMSREVSVDPAVIEEARRRLETQGG